VSYLRLYRAYQGASHRGKFCEKNYLDEKAMAEISNVAAQLGEIVSGMGIPILSGGSTEDYLCAVATGLIQFVCVREGRELYRSLTADRILIHPGSVMFRRTAGAQAPRYIVAGEVVRTTRMYAMSVSPLSERALEKINPDLLEALGGRSGAGGRKDNREEKLKQVRDFTNRIRIGDALFNIETIKVKKVVILPWEQLSKVKDAIVNEAFYKKLRGTIIVNSKYTLLREEKLPLILSLVPILAIDGAESRTWPRKGHFNSRENLRALLTELPKLVTPAVWKPGKKELGFISLFTDGEGNYRLTCSRGLHTSLNESLASLETLIDEMGEDIDGEIKHVVNRTYRRLSDYLG
jgi:HrpA-like RNA helicase